MYKYTVFGYIRGFEKKLSLQNIPTLINYLCLQFYFHGEYFEKIGDDLEISNDKMMVKSKPDKCGDNEAFGKTWIKSMSNCVATWTFKLNANQISIYITSSEKLYDRDTSCFFLDNGICAGKKLFDPQMYGFVNKMPGHLSILFWTMARFTEQDLMKLTLNTKNGTIALQRNDEDVIVLVDNIVKGRDISYKLAVGFYNFDEYITLIDFTYTLS